MSTDGLDKSKRRFLTAATSVVGAVGAGFVAVPFVLNMQPSERAKAAGAPVEIDISKLEPGMKVTSLWRGKPVWVVRRTKQNLDDLQKLQDKLQDPDSTVTSQQPEYVKGISRSIKPEYMVMEGICTHLGCSPTHRPELGAPDLGGPEWLGGFFCPCHGSRFDLSGRVYAGAPAPTNLKVPPHKYLSDTKIIIGINPGEGVA